MGSNRLRELFLGSLEGRTDPEIVHQKILQVVQMCGQNPDGDVDPAGALCTLAVSLEDDHPEYARPIYVAMLQLTEAGTWERAVTLQQRGRLAIIMKDWDTAKEALDEAADLGPRLPRLKPGAQLFGGAFPFDSTREKYCEKTYNLLTKVYYDLGDMEKAQAWHQKTKQMKEEVPKAEAAPSDEAAAVWQEALPQRTVRGFSWGDGEEGSGTVLVYVNPEHLGGFEIPSSGYVRTRTEAGSLEIRIRTGTEELVLWFSPLSAPVVPQDTTHRVRKGKLRVTLFKEDKKQKWWNLLGSGKAEPMRAAPKQEEDLDEAALAALPTPDGRADNLPSRAKHLAGAGPAAALPTPAGRPQDNLPTAARPPPTAAYPASAAPPSQPPSAAADAAAGPESGAVPSWVEELKLEATEIRVVLVEGLTAADLEIGEADGEVRVACSGLDGVLQLPSASTKSAPSWSKKRRTLTLQRA